jgi:plastocyanin
MKGWRYIALAAGLVAALGACGDDAPDHAFQAERAAALAAEYRAGTTTPAVPESPATSRAGSASAPTASTANPVITDPVVTVAPTGVVVPVIALDNSFRPEQLTIQVGDEVLWQNNGRNEHNILNVESADEGFEADGAWGIDVEAFQPGDVFSHVFTEPGNYRYYCTIHGNTEVGMVGTIIVEG